MSVFKPKGRKHFRYNFIYKGHRFSNSTGKTTERAARAVEKAKRNEVKELWRSGAFDYTRASLDVAVDDYWLSVAKHQGDNQEISMPDGAVVMKGGTAGQLNKLLDYIGSDTLISDINDKMVADFVARRRGDKNSRYKDKKTAPFVSNATVNREVQLLRQVIRRSKKILKTKPQDIDWGLHLLPEPDPPSRALTLEQEVALAENIIPHALPLLIFMIKTGVREKNAITLDWSQITFERSNTGGPRGFIKFMVKDKSLPNGREHILPIDDELHWLLVEQGIKERGRVFTYGDPCKCVYCKRFAGQEIKSFRRAFKGALRRAGISPHFRIHDLRHTVGVRILQKLGDLKAAQEYLGHKDIRSTMRYAKHDVQKKHEIMQLLGKSRTQTDTHSRLKTVK